MRSIQMLFIVFIAACSMQPGAQTGSEGLAESWTRFNNCTTQAEAARLAKRVLADQPEHRYTLAMLSAIIESGSQQNQREETIEYLEALISRLSNEALIELVELE